MKKSILILFSLLILSSFDLYGAQEAGFEKKHLDEKIALERHNAYSAMVEWERLLKYDYGNWERCNEDLDDRYRAHSLNAHELEKERKEKFSE